jgi:hypothetical protein
LNIPQKKEAKIKNKLKIFFSIKKIRGINLKKQKLQNTLPY